MAKQHSTKRQRGNSGVLDVGTQTAVAQYAIDHPELTDQEVATELGVTAAQVRYARQKADAGKLSVQRSGPNTLGRALAIRGEKDSTELLEDQLHFALSQISADQEMPPDERLAAIATASRMLRTLQATKLIRHMKERDAELLKRIIRRYDPHASEERCTQIYLEELQLWQADADSH